MQTLPLSSFWKAQGQSADCRADFAQSELTATVNFSQTRLRASTTLHLRRKPFGDKRDYGRKLFIMNQQDGVSGARPDDCCKWLFFARIVDVACCA